MRIWFFLVITICLWGAPQGVNGMEKERVNQKISFPAEAGSWKWDGKEKAYNTRTIFDYIDGAGELFLAYNFRGMTVRRFEKLGQPALVAELYDMGSSEDAYGVFSFERQDEDAGIGQGSEFGGGLLRFWKGKYFVSVYGEGESPEIGLAILALGKEIAKSILVRGPAPKLINILPDGKAGLVGKSIRYLHSHILLNQRFFVATQNILKLNANTEAVLAQYLRYGKKTHLLVVRYPTAQEAAVALQSFKKAYMPEAAKELLRTEDKKWTGARRQREFVLIVFGGSSEKEVGELMKDTEDKIGGN